jgi:hypothetical protein
MHEDFKDYESNEDEEFKEGDEPYQHHEERLMQDDDFYQPMEVVAEKCSLCNEKFT